MIAWLVETLIVTSALMLLVLALRESVRQQFGAKVAYALWLLPALRLVMPPLVSFMPVTLPIASVAPTSGVLSQLIRERVTQFDVTPTLAADAGASMPWPLILAVLWLSGALAFALWQVVTYRRFTRSVIKSARVRRSPARGIKLLASPRVKGPMAFGLMSRFIVFPHDALMRFDVEEHAMALSHELAHHRRGDLLANAFALVFLALHWCNPLAWIAHRAFRADQEMACDADVINAIRDQGLGHAYGRALVKCASGRDSLAICHLTTVDRLKRRLSMLSKKSPSVRRRLAGFALTGALVLSGLAMTASGQGMAAQMGAKVSAALPQTLALPHKMPLVPMLVGASAAMTAVTDEMHAEHAEHTAAVDREEAVQEAEDAAVASVVARSAVRAVPVPRSVVEPPAPPAPPSPPSFADIPTPPAPPAPPTALAPIPRTIPVPAVDQRRYGYAMRMHHPDFADIPTKAEIQEMIPLIEVTEGSSCAGARDFTEVRERTVNVDGYQRRKITIKICGKDIQRHARAEALKGLEEARADIAAQEEFSARSRSEILADLDRQIARMRAKRD